MKAQIKHDSIKKIQPNFIKGIGKVQFDYHTFFLPLVTRVNCLLDQDDIVLNLSILNEAPLVLQNDPGEDFFKSVCNNFCDDFVPCVAERDRAESGKALGAFIFWN